MAFSQEMVKALQLIDGYCETQVYLVSGLTQEEGEDEGECILGNSSPSKRHGAKVLSADLRTSIPNLYKSHQKKGGTP